MSEIPATGESVDARWRRSIAAVGIVGALALGASFALPPGVPPASASVHTLLSFATREHALISFDAWLEGSATVLYVIFILGLLQMAGSRRPLARQLTVLAVTLIVAVSLFYDITLLALAQSPKIGGGQTVATPAVAYGLFAGAEHVFLITPSLFLPLGVVLLGCSVLPRPFGVCALVFGSLSQVLGLVGVFTVTAQNNGAVGTLINVFLGSASCWIMCYPCAGGCYAIHRCPVCTACRTVHRSDRAGPPTTFPFPD